MSAPSLNPDSKNPPSPDRFPVFVVEDDPQISRLVQATLTASGYQLTGFASAEAALEHTLAHIEPSLFVVDVRLPGMDGLELAEKLREIHHDFEVVVVTAHADVESLGRALDLGIFRCLSKPFAVGELRLAVAGAANRLFLRLDRRTHISEIERSNAELVTALAQLKTSESRRVLSERLASIGHFAAALAHEINNPLTYVQTNLALLRDAAPDLVGALQAVSTGRSWAELDPEVAHNAAQAGFELLSILDECTTGLKLIKQISGDLSSVARYRTDAEEVFDFNDVVRTACRVARVEPRLRAKLALDLASEHVDVRGSTGRLAQVVMNLVANAAEASDPTKQRPNTVTVSTRREGDRVVLEVSDTGIGISHERKQRIFEPYVTFREGGTGLGLGLVQEIVNECGGEILIESEADVGSTFRVVLPAARVAVPTGSMSAVRMLPSHADVLIVDDDAAIRRAYSRVFRGKKLRFAENGEEALRAILSQRPDLVVTDLVMPEMNGVELYESICSRWPDLAKRVVFVTGTDSLLGAVRERAPTCPVVKKPFVAAELESLMARLLG